MSDFTHPNAPEDLKSAVNDITRMQHWVKGKSVEELLEALDFIYFHHHVPRSIVQDQINALRHSETVEKLDHLAKPHWVLWATLAAGAIAAGAAVVLLFR